MSSRRRRLDAASRVSCADPHLREVRTRRRLTQVSRGSNVCATKPEATIVSCSVKLRAPRTAYGGFPRGNVAFDIVGGLGKLLNALLSTSLRLAPRYAHGGRVGAVGWDFAIVVQLPGSKRRRRALGQPSGVLRGASRSSIRISSDPPPARRVSSIPLAPGASPGRRVPPRNTGTPTQR